MICPYCAEKIQDTAKKCKHCGEWIDESAQPTAAIARSEPKKHQIDNSSVKKYQAVLKKEKQGKFDITKTETVFANSEQEAREKFSRVCGYSIKNNKLRREEGAGRFSCPNCKSQFTSSQKNIGCAIVILIFISFGIGLIMIPFLPYYCSCEICGHKWKT